VNEVDAVGAIEYETLLLCSVRYVLPRPTALAAVVARYVIKRADALSEDIRKEIAREIIETDGGDLPVRPEWQHALKALEAAKGET
jgi:hypothetical protein